MPSHQCRPACTAGWQPSRKCHCAGCGENFSTESNFIKHKPGECLPPNECGLVLNKRGVWIREGETDFDERFHR